VNNEAAGQRDLHEAQRNVLHATTLTESARNTIVFLGTALAGSRTMQASPAVNSELETDRVRRHTAPYVNHRIDQLTRASIVEHKAAGPAAIQRRLSELDQEWDVDRALMVNFAIAGGASFAVGLARYARGSLLGPRRKGFLYLFGTQLTFLLVHGVVGWCPPASVFRRLGFRTQREIEVERAGLRDASSSREA
jgi:hypothetical protein